MVARVSLPFFYGLNVNNRVFYEFSMCEIFLPLMLPFLKEVR